ncbi:MAG: glycosyltransferase, partial [Actinobacteria bacterium]|nr:glycosyltransferase [Actinomycetota bacterium]
MVGDATTQVAELAIVIVNWNTRELLKNCLESLPVRSKDLHVKVVVVDNGSSDQSREMVERGFPDVDLMHNPVNVGFAAANNQALSNFNSDFVLLLNSDTRIVDDAIQVMLEYLKAHSDVAAVAPQLTHPQHRFRVLS